jgi:hypothetical protein
LVSEAAKSSSARSSKVTLSARPNNAPIEPPIAALASAARPQQDSEQATGHGAETGSDADRRIVLRPRAVDLDEAALAPRHHGGIVDPRVNRHVVLEGGDGLGGRLLALEHERFESVHTHLLGTVLSLPRVLKDTRST